MNLTPLALPFEKKKKITAIIQDVSAHGHQAQFYISIHFISIHLFVKRKRRETLSPIPTENSRLQVAVLFGAGCNPT